MAKIVQVALQSLPAEINVGEVVNTNAVITRQRFHPLELGRVSKYSEPFSSRIYY